MKSKQIQKIQPRSGKNGNINSSLTRALPVKSVQIAPCKNWFFTFNNYKDPEDPLFLEKIFKLICSSFYFQEEKGESGTKHLQGSITLLKKGRWSEFGLPKQMSWSKTRNIDAANLYCIKDDTNNGKKWIFPEPEPELECLKEDSLYPWQKTIDSLCKETPNDRDINWVYDLVGNTGKSKFAKFMAIKRNSIICTGGSAKDIANLVKNIIDNGRSLRRTSIFIFDVPRCKDGRISYAALEEIKNGLITNTKYESGTFYFNTPHVWIFSNDLPDYTKMSSDRWKTWTINNKNELIVYTCEEQVKEFKETMLDRM